MTHVCVCVCTQMWMSVKIRCSVPDRSVWTLRDRIAVCHADLDLALKTERVSGKYNTSGLKFNHEWTIIIVKPGHALYNKQMIKNKINSKGKNTHTKLKILAIIKNLKLNTTKPVLSSKVANICSNSQNYIMWVKVIDFSFMSKIIRILSKDHVPWRYFVNILP